MRSFLIASAGLALAGSGAAEAQRTLHAPGTSYRIPGDVMQAPMATPARPGPIAARPVIVHTTSRQVGGARTPRWGSKIGGRWWGGANAPGGWAGYRRPHRGWAVPGYWNAPRFYVSDWSTYGLAQPPYGYNWARYYDDAVLIDSRGSVYDTTSGIDWDRYDAAGYANNQEGVDGAGYPQNDAVYAGSSDQGGPDRGHDGRGYDARGGPRRDTGIGGAAVGAVVGGVAGNVIAGRGSRLGGTLIGAGVGAAAGYAIDKAEDRGRRAPPPPVSGYDTRYGDTRYGDMRYGAGYASPPALGYARAPGTWVSPDGVTTVTTTNGGGYQGGSTTVVVQSALVVTTTTTTDYYDAVTYRPKKVWKKRAWRAKPACYCR